MKSPMAPQITGFQAWRYYAKFFHDSVGVLTALHQRYGRAVAVREWLPLRKRNRWCMVLSGVEYNRQVLSDPGSFQSSAIAIRGRKGSALSRLNRGLIGMNGEEHRQQRRLVIPLFAPKAIAGYYSQMVDVVAGELKTWPTGKSSDVAQLVSRISCRISCYNLFRRDVDGAVRLGEVFEEHLRRSHSLGTLMMPLDLPGTPFRRLMRHAEQVAEHLREMISRRRVLGQDHHDMLDRLIKVHQADPSSMPEDTLVEQVAVLFAASHETVAKAVTWSLFLLSQHPACMAELHQELRSASGTDPLSLDDLQRLPWLDAVTKEAMRLFPPVPWAARKIRTETELAGHPVRRRDYIILSHFITHRSPDVFPRPLQFSPQRWFVTNPDCYAYVPFSAGPRTCIGKLLGTVIIKLTVAMIVQRFRLTLIPNSRIDRAVRVTLAPKYGLPMIAEPQDGRFEAVPVRGNVHQMVDLSGSEQDRRPHTIPFPVGRPKSQLRRAT